MLLKRTKILKLYICLATFGATFIFKNVSKRGFSQSIIRATEDFNVKDSKLKEERLKYFFSKALVNPDKYFTDLEDKYIVTCYEVYGFYKNFFNNLKIFNNLYREEKLGNNSTELLQLLFDCRKKLYSIFLKFVRIVSGFSRKDDDKRGEWGNITGICLTNYFKEYKVIAKKISDLIKKNGGLSFPEEFKFDKDIKSFYEKTVNLMFYLETFCSDFDFVIDIVESCSRENYFIKKIISDNLMDGFKDSSAYVKCWVLALKKIKDNIGYILKINDININCINTPIFHRNDYYLYDRTETCSNVLEDLISCIEKLNNKCESTSFENLNEEEKNILKRMEVEAVKKLIDNNELKEIRRAVSDKLKNICDEKLLEEVKQVVEGKLKTNTVYDEKLLEEVKQAVSDKLLKEKITYDEKLLEEVKQAVANKLLKERPIYDKNNKKYENIAAHYENISKFDEFFKVGNKSISNESNDNLYFSPFYVRMPSCGAKLSKKSEEEYEYFYLDRDAFRLDRELSFGNFVPLDVLLKPSVATTDKLNCNDIINKDIKGIIEKLLKEEFCSGGNKNIVSSKYCKILEILNKLKHLYYNYEKIFKNLNENLNKKFVADGNYKKISRELDIPEFLDVQYGRIIKNLDETLFELNLSKKLKKELKKELCKVLLKVELRQKLMKKFGINSEQKDLVGEPETLKYLNIKEFVSGDGDMSNILSGINRLGFDSNKMVGELKEELKKLAISKFIFPDKGNDGKSNKDYDRIRHILRHMRSYNLNAEKIYEEAVIELIKEGLLKEEGLDNYLKFDNLKKKLEEFVPSEDDNEILTTLEGIVSLGSSDKEKIEEIYFDSGEEEVEQALNDEDFGPDSYEYTSEIVERINSLDFDDPDIMEKFGDIKEKLKKEYVREELNKEDFASGKYNKILIALNKISNLNSYEAETIKEVKEDLSKEDVQKLFDREKKLASSSGKCHKISVVLDEMPRFGDKSVLKAAKKLLRDKHIQEALEGEEFTSGKYKKISAIVDKILSLNSDNRETVEEIKKILKKNEVQETLNSKDFVSKYEDILNILVNVPCLDSDYKGTIKKLKKALNSKNLQAVLNSNDFASKYKDISMILNRIASLDSYNMKIVEEVREDLYEEGIWKLLEEEAFVSGEYEDISNILVEANNLYFYRGIRVGDIKRMLGKENVKEILNKEDFTSGKYKKISEIVNKINSLDFNDNEETMKELKEYLNKEEVKKELGKEDFTSGKYKKISEIVNKINSLDPDNDKKIEELEERLKEEKAKEEDFISGRYKNILEDLDKINSLGFNIKEIMKGLKEYLNKEEVKKELGKDEFVSSKCNDILEILNKINSLDFNDEVKKELGKDEFVSSKCNEILEIVNKIEFYCFKSCELIEELEEHLGEEGAKRKGFVSNVYSEVAKVLGEIDDLKPISEYQNFLYNASINMFGSKFYRFFSKDNSNNSELYEKACNLVEYFVGLARRFNEVISKVGEYKPYLQKLMRFDSDFDSRSLSFDAHYIREYIKCYARHFASIAACLERFMGYNGKFCCFGDADIARANYEFIKRLLRGYDKVFENMRDFTNISIKSYPEYFELTIINRYDGKEFGMPHRFWWYVPRSSEENSFILDIVNAIIKLRVKYLLHKNPDFLQIENEKKLCEKTRKTISVKYGVADCLDNLISEDLFLNLVRDAVSEFKKKLDLERVIEEESKVAVKNIIKKFEQEGRTKDEILKKLDDICKSPSGDDGFIEVEELSYLKEKVRSAVKDKLKIENIYEAEKEFYGVVEELVENFSDFFKQKTTAKIIEIVKDELHKLSV